MYFRQRAKTLVPSPLWRAEIKDDGAQCSGGWEIGRFNGSCAASGAEKSETKAGLGRLEKLDGNVWSGACRVKVHSS